MLLLIINIKKQFMKVFFNIIIIILFSLQAHAQIEWPEGKKAAIVLTYDDALKSQLDIAIPQLNKHKLAGTFYLVGGMTEKDMERWREASNKGHELGNHTLYHPCSKNNFKAHPRFTSENYDLYSIIREIDMMNKILYGIDGHKPRTYAYPCTELKVGNKDYTDTLKLSKLVAYARVGGNQDSVVTDFRNLNPLQVPSYALVNNEEADDLINFVKNVQQKGGMGVLMFHGVGGDYLKVSKEAHEKLLQYLSDHNDEVWVGTFMEVMDYALKSQKSSKATGNK